MILKRKRYRKFKKFLSNSTIGLAMVLATTGLKIPIRPYRSSPQPDLPYTLAITNKRGIMQNLPLVNSNHFNTVANFTITAMVSRPQHFIVTPSVHLYRFIKKTIKSFFSDRITETEVVQGEGDRRSTDTIDNLLEPSETIVDVESHEFVGAEVMEAETHLTLHGNTVHKDARKMRTAVTLDHPAFISSFDGLLKEAYKDIDTRVILDILAQALHPTPMPYKIVNVHLPLDTKVRLRALKVVHESDNIDLQRVFRVLAAKSHMRV